MSLDTWKAEFYPVPADRVPASEAIDACILKWTGLKFENIKKHGLEKHGSHMHIIERDVDYPADPVYDSARHMHMSTDNCALCAHYYYTEGVDLEVMSPCERCPIYLSQGRDCDSQFLSWVRLNNAAPMLATLRKAKEYETAHANKQL